MEGTRGFTRSATVATAAGSPTPTTATPSPTRALPALPAGDSVVTRADGFVAWLATTTGAGVDDAVRIDRIAALERVKGALAAAQVRQTVAFAESQRAGMPAWTPERAAARSIGSQVALAHVALARALVGAMPQTMAALRAGRISEAAAEGVHRAVEVVDPVVRREVDRRLGPELGQLGERSLAEAARRVVADVDQEAATRRVERVARGRRVTLRTAPDGMAYLTLLAPMAEAAGAFQAVEAEATALLGEPTRCGPASRKSAFWLDEPVEPSPPSGAEHSREAFFGSSDVRRTRSQMMADVVVSRLTGRAIGQPVPIEIQLVMTDSTLDEETDSDAEPADGAPSRTDRGSHDNNRRANPAHETSGHGSAASPARGERRDASSGHPAFASGPGPTVNPSGQNHKAEPGGRPGTNSPAKIVGAGWLPAGFARELVRRTAAAGSDVTVRCVVTDPGSATVIGLESRRHHLNQPRGRAEPIPILAPTSSMQRLFRGGLRRLVVVRDQACRTPFCAAAIRAVDHVTPARRDGPTCAHNAEGKCDRCNLTKEAPGWNVIVLSPPPVARSNPEDPPWKQLVDELLAADAEPPARSASGHRSAVVTPTGHRYESTAPSATG